MGRVPGVPLPDEIDYLCAWCGDVYRGPHAGAHVDNPTMVNEIDGNRAVSHGLCPDCYDTQIAALRERVRQRQQNEGA